MVATSNARFSFGPPRPRICPPRGAAARRRRRIRRSGPRDSTPSCGPPRPRVETLKSEKNALSAGIGRAADRAAEAQRLKPQARRTRRGYRRRRRSGCRNWSARSRRCSPTCPTCWTRPFPTAQAKPDNVVVRTWGTPRALGFEPEPHWDIGERLGILDFERAAKLSGARFAVLRGAGARLSRALVSFFLDRAGESGYTEIDPPFLVNRQTMWSTGQLTKFSDAMFTDTDADLFLIPTAEVPLTALHRDEILARGSTSAALYRILAVLSQRGGRGRERYARIDPPASIRESRTGLAHRARTTRSKRSSD